MTDKETPKTFAEQLEDVCRFNWIPEFNARALASLQKPNNAETVDYECNAEQTIKVVKDIAHSARLYSEDFTWLDYIPRQTVVFLREMGFVVEYYPIHKQWFVSWGEAQVTKLKESKC